MSWAIQNLVFEIPRTFDLCMGVGSRLECFGLPLILGGCKHGCGEPVVPQFIVPNEGECVGVSWAIQSCVFEIPRTFDLCMGVGSRWECFGLLLTLGGCKHGCGEPVVPQLIVPMNRGVWLGCRW